MTEPKTVKEQLLAYYMAHNHTEFTNTVIKVLSCTDPEIEDSLETHEDLIRIFGFDLIKTFIRP
jgi:hypothetical protein